MYFRNEYAYLSNMYKSPFKFKDEYGELIEFPTVEHAYQYFKTINKNERAEILNASTPTEAKKLGRKCTLRGNFTHSSPDPRFNSLAELLMYRLVRAKFKQNPKLAQQLVATDNVHLVEENTWHDNRWGICKCGKCSGGANRLGHVLMTVREEIKIS